MTPTPPGRNDRCPCGSGKKYKHCCLHTVHDAETARRRLRTAEGHVVDGALELSAKRWGNDLLIDAWYDFWNGEPPEDITGTPEFGQMFLPWFVFSYLPPKAGDEGEVDEREDDGMAPDPDAGVEWPTRPLALEWLAHQRLVDALDRRYAETACRSPLSVFVVEAVVPQQSLDIRDVLTGARFHVLETGASRTLRVADLIFASVVTIDGVSVLFGASHFIVPPAWHTRIIDWRERLLRRKWTRADLARHDVEIRDLYFQVRQALLDPAPPRLVNSDGEPLEVTTLEFAVTLPVDEVFERLLPLATVGGAQFVRDVVRDERGAVTHAEMSWVKAGNRKHASWDNTILGRLMVDAGVVAAEANSSARANRLTREIGKRLGRHARRVDRTVHDLEAELDRRRRAPGTGSDAPPEDADDPSSAVELQELTDELTCRHWAEWLDVRVPALGNKTPRQAARTAKGRERLAALFGDFDRRSESQSDATRDALREVKRTLGME